MDESNQPGSHQICLQIELGTAAAVTGGTGIQRSLSKGKREVKRIEEYGRLGSTVRIGGDEDKRGILRLVIVVSTCNTPQFPTETAEL